MKLIELYKAIIEIGIAYDPRGEEYIRKELENKKKQFNLLDEKKKEFFDQEKLINPYSDSRIYNGTGDEDINSLMVGIDFEAPELVLLDRLKEKGRKIDAAMSHHPEGTGLVALHEVMYMQADVMHRAGVPITIAEGVLTERIRDVSRSLLPVNYSRAIDAARLLEIPFLGAHTPADNCVATFLQKLFDEKKPKTLVDVLELLIGIEEYRISCKAENGPKIVCGTKRGRTGKVYVDMTGGTEGPTDAIEKLALAGVGTIVGMHMSKGHLKKAEQHHINVVIAGHMASDAVGLNIVLDEVEKKLGALEVIGCSGFTRIKHS